MINFKMKNLDKSQLQEIEGGIPIPVLIAFLGMAIVAYSSADEMAEAACQAHEDVCN